MSPSREDALLYGNASLALALPAFEWRVERSAPGTFTASETFDAGKDVGSPVALGDYDRAPFKFNGKIERIHIRYLK